MLFALLGSRKNDRRLIHDKYEHPLVSRYASKEMSYIWSPKKKFSTWRELWIALAEGERELGLNITEEQIEEMKQHIHDIDFDLAEKKEAEFRHDVMAHVHTFGVSCPKAMPIIHLGATSCYVGDNTDIIQMRKSFVLLRNKTVKLFAIMKDFAEKYKATPTLGFTHFQPAQLTTIGKRCSLWLQDLVFDFNEIQRQIETLPMRGVKGTTGTQATFLELFDGDHEKVKRLNVLVCNKMGFEKWIPVAGQTYTRKIDYAVLSALSGIGQSAYKMCSDIRLLASMKEIGELSISSNIVRISLTRYLLLLISNRGTIWKESNWFECDGL